MGASARGAESQRGGRVEPERLAEEQAALRRVATLVASGAPSAEVFTAVVQEVAQVMRLPMVGLYRYDSDNLMTVLATWSDRPHVFQPGTRWPLEGESMIARVRRTGRPVRVEDYSDLPGELAAGARDSGLNATAGAPIMVGGVVWGAMGLASPDQPLPDRVEHRLAAFTELVGTAIANSQARDEVARLAEEQAALRRVATLVAAGAPPAEVFEAVSVEVAALIPSDGSALTRYEDDGSVTAISGWTREGGYSYVGNRYPLEGTVSGLVFETGRPARVDDYGDAPHGALAAARELGWRSSVGAPITVDGRLWGVLALASKSEKRLPADAEPRLAAFTELVATAIAKSQAHEELERLAREQAALRRVATLAARGAPPEEVVESVGAEVGPLLDADGAGVTRYDEDGMFTVLGGWASDGGETFTGRRFGFAGSLSGLVFETRRPSRIDTFEGQHGEAADAVRQLGWRCAAGAPILVENRLWGVLMVYSKRAVPFPRDTETRLGEFTEIVATAIGNSQAHEQLERLAGEQAALRRVATLAARGAPPGEVVEAAGAEVGRLLDADGAGVMRYEDDGTFTSLGGWISDGDYPFKGRRFALGGSLSGMILESRRPSRIDSFEERQDEIAELARTIGWRCAAGVPVFVEGRIWGALVVYSKHVEPFPPGTEIRLAEFTEIIATAIANAESRAELEVSRARIVSTADATRRRIERDLHDGAQQRILSLALEVRAAQAAAPAELTRHRAELSHIADGLTDVLDDLREIALGLHPALLAEGGLAAALNSLGQRSSIPVSLDVRADGRLPEHVEVAAYYVVSEALTNAAKYSRASKVEIDVVLRDGTLRVTVGDDGVGGADPVRGSGLLGLNDRVAAIGGTLLLASRPGEGTRLVADLPLADSSI